MWEACSCWLYHAESDCTLQGECLGACDTTFVIARHAWLPSQWQKGALVHVYSTDLRSGPSVAAKGLGGHACCMRLFLARGWPRDI